MEVTRIGATLLGLALVACGAAANGAGSTDCAALASCRASLPSSQPPAPGEEGREYQNADPPFRLRPPAGASLARAAEEDRVLLSWLSGNVGVMVTFWQQRPSPPVDGSLDQYLRGVIERSGFVALAAPAAVEIQGAEVARAVRASHSSGLKTEIRAMTSKGWIIICNVWASADENATALEAASVLQSFEIVSGR